MPKFRSNLRGDLEKASAPSGARCAKEIHLQAKPEEAGTQAAHPMARAERDLAGLRGVWEGRPARPPSCQGGPSRN